MLIPNKSLLLTIYLPLVSSMISSDGDWWSKINMKGPLLGYHPNAQKSWLQSSNPISLRKLKRSSMEWWQLTSRQKEENILLVALAPNKGGHVCSDEERKLLNLPIRRGGLSIPLLRDLANEQDCNSKKPRLDDNFQLNKRDFQDALALRNRRKMGYLPTICECGKQLTMPSYVCKAVSFINVTMS